MKFVEKYKRFPEKNFEKKGLDEVLVLKLKKTPEKYLQEVFGETSGKVTEGSFGVFCK